MDIWFFDLNLGKLHNCAQYFGSNIVEGVAESWVEVDGGGLHSLVIPFYDIFKNLSLVVSYTPVMLYSQWNYHHCTRDIPVTRFHLIPFLEVEILVGERGGARVYTSYPLLLVSHVCPCIRPAHKWFAQFSMFMLSWSAASLNVIFRTT